MTDQHPITPPPKLVEQWSDIKPMEDAVSKLGKDCRTKAQSKAELALNALDHILRHSQTDHGANTIRQALQHLKS